MTGMRTMALWATLTLALAAMTGCSLLGLDAADELDPVPSMQTTASAIWDEYQRETSRTPANDSYRGRWVNIYLDGVRREAGGEPAGIDGVAGNRLIIRTPGAIGQMEFKFRFIEQAQEYRRGDRPYVLCNVTGTDLSRTKITFAHCRPSERQAAAPPRERIDQGAPDPTKKQ